MKQSVPSFNCDGLVTIFVLFVFQFTVPATTVTESKARSATRLQTTSVSLCICGEPATPARKVDSHRARVRARAREMGYTACD